MPPRGPEQQLARARRMRRAQTFAEEAMWRALRDRRIGAKFRRQVPIGPYIADFACLEAKLIVEVDGPSHETVAGAGHDARRDAWFAAQGWRVVRVVRVANGLVTGGGDLAVDAIAAALRTTADGVPQAARPSSVTAARRHLLPHGGRREAGGPSPVWREKVARRSRVG